MRTLLFAAALLSLQSTISFAQSPPAPAPVPDVKGAEKIRVDAQTLEPLFKTELAGQFLHASAELPSVTPRTVLVSKSDRSWRTPAEAAALPEEQRSQLEERSLDENFYYNTGYGSPLVYARALELASSRAGFNSLEGKRVLDFGYGTVGQLRLMAECGAHAVGVDIDQKLAALYRERDDQGEVERGKSTPGRITLLHGQWPAEPDIVASVKAEAPEGFDLITSKNTLKNGYLHPTQPVDDRRLVKLGVSDAAFVEALAGALKPGGLLVIYNISPRPSRENEQYKPWADGRCPFSRGTLERAGFEVLAFDEVDDDTAEAIFKALGYPTTDSAGEKDLFAHFTICRKAP